MSRKTPGTDRRPEGRSGATRSPASHTFLVHLWKETRADGEHEPIWRGTLSDMRGRQLGSFSTATELAGILGKFSGVNVLLRFTTAGAAKERSITTG